MARTATRLGALLAVVALVGCPGSDDEESRTFSQKDLAGEWDFTVLQLGASVAAGTVAGWIRGTLRVDEAGQVTILSSLNSLGGTAVPAVATIWTIDADGNVTATSSVYTQYHAKLNAARDLLVATATATPTGAPTLRISQKRVPGVTFSTADLAGTWRYNDLGGGSLVRYEYGTATIASDGAVSVVQGFASDTGTVAPAPGAETLAVSADGVVTAAGDASWRGFLSADKSLIVATHTAGPHEYSLNVIVRGASSLSQKDFAGAWAFHSLSNGASAAAWGHGSVTASDAGAVSFTEAVDASGPTSLPAPFTVAVQGDGTVTQVAPPGSDFHGVLSADGKLTVGVSSRDAGTATYACSLIVSTR